MNWLFIRGLAREQRHWGDFREVFAREVAGARVHALDLPGTGTEYRRTSPATVRGIAEDIRERWLALRDEHPGPWGAFSISLGGMVAMAWAAAHPRDFARVVLTNSSAGGLSLPWERMNLAIAPRVVRGAFEPDPTRRERGVLAMTTRMRDDLDAIAAGWALFADRAPARSNIARHLWAASQFKAPARIETPLLVLASAGDEFTQPVCSQRIAAHFRAPIEMHPRGGHDLPTDDAVWVGRAVNAWLERTGSEAKPGFDRT